MLPGSASCVVAAFSARPAACCAHYTEPKPMTPSVSDPSITSRPLRHGEAAPSDNLVAPRVPRGFLVLLLSGTGLAAGIVLVPFWAQLFLGITLAASVFPLNQALTKRMPNHPVKAAMLTTFGILAVIVAPVIAIAGYAMTQLSEGMTWLRSLLAANSWQEGLNRCPKVVRTVVDRVLDLFSLDVEELREYAEQATQAARDWMPQLFGMSMSALGTLLMALITCCIFLVKGQQVKELVVEVLPIKRDDADKMLGRLRDVSTASFLGLGCTAISHALVIAVAFWLVGVPHVTFFGFLALFAAFLPIVSSMLLYAPVAAVLGLIEAPWLGIALFVGCFVGSQLLDNLIKPFAQQDKIPLHGALGFFSVIGGLTLFGLMGTIVGPMAMVVALSLFGIYRRDFLQREEIIKA